MGTGLQEPLRQLRTRQEHPWHNPSTDMAPRGDGDPTEARLAAERDEALAATQRTRRCQSAGPPPRRPCLRTAPPERSETSHKDTEKGYKLYMYQLQLGAALRMSDTESWDPPPCPSADAFWHGWICAESGRFAACRYLGVLMPSSAAGWSQERAAQRCGT